MARSEPREGEFQITPQEERFLRAFFRRHAGRWLALGVGSAALVAALALLLAPDAPEPTDPALLEGLRSESQALRTELQALTARLDELDGSVERVANLEDRTHGALRRLEKVESSLSSKRVGPASSWDASAVLERLESLERRQSTSEQEHRDLARRLLSGGSLPAAPSPAPLD